MRSVTHKTGYLYQAQAGESREMSLLNQYIAAATKNFGMGEAAEKARLLALDPTLPAQWDAQISARTQAVQDARGKQIVGGRHNGAQLRRSGVDTDCDDHDLL